MRATLHGPATRRRAALLPLTGALVGLTLMLLAGAAPPAWARGARGPAGLPTGAVRYAPARLFSCSNGSYTTISPCSQGGSVPVNSTNVSLWYQIQNNGYATANYMLSCSYTAPVTSCSVDPEVDVTSGSTGFASVTYSTGSTAGTGSVTLSLYDRAGGDRASVTQSITVTAPTYTVAVTPDNALVNATANSSSNTYTFAVTNNGTGDATYALSCTNPMGSCSLPGGSTVSVTKNGGWKNVDVTYQAGVPGDTGTVKLTASYAGYSDVGSIHATAYPPPPIVATTPYNGDFHETALCAVSCFDATTSYTTPAYTSLDVARSVTLAYSSATASPRPVVQVDATDTSVTPADQLSLRLRRPDASYETFANGSQEMFFTNRHAIERLAAQVNPAAPLATGAYPYSLIVTSYWTSAGLNNQTLIPIRVLVDNEQASPYGAGWGIAGLQRDTVLGDSVLITDGTGTMAFFRRQSCSSSTCTYLSPPGDFSTLTSPVTIGADGIAYTRRSPDGTTVGFNTVGREVYVQDRFGNKTSYGYDTSNRLITITDPVLKVTTLHYNAAHKLDYIQDPMGRKTLITIDGAGDLTQIQDPAGGLPLRATYDSQHRLITLTDRAGHVANFGYDFAGKLAADTLPTIMVGGENVRPVVQYQAPERVVLVDPASGVGSSSTPAAAVDTGTVRGTVTDPRGNTTTYAMNAFGEARWMEQPLGRATTIEYDDSARVREVVEPSGNAQFFSWSGPDLTELDDFLADRTVRVHYEPTYHQVDSVYGNVTPVKNYWSAGKLDSTRVGGALTKFTYDTFGRLLKSTDPLGHVDSVAYAASGLRNRTSVSVAGRMTSYGTDTYGRVVTTTAPDTSVTTTVYDVLNRVQQMVGPVHDTTIYTYGDSLHLTKVRDAKHQTHQSTYNALGWMVTSTDPTNHTETVAYDSAGNVVQTTDRANHVVKRFYDALDQLDSVVADGATTKYHTQIHSDLNGRFQADSNAASTDTVFFDYAGRPTSEVTVRGGHRYVRASTYDSAGSRTQLAISGVWNATINYAYDPVTHQLDTLTDVNGGKTTLGYNSDGLVDSVRLPTTSGLTVTTSYPSTHTPTAITYSDYGVNLSLGVRYAYNADAQLAVRTPAVPLIEGYYTGREFQYDSLQRLVGYDDYSASSGGYVNTCGDSTASGDGFSCYSFAPGTKDTTDRYMFSYDAVGNRTDSGAVLDAANRLLRFSGDTLVYDLDGNLVHRYRLPEGSGFDQTYHWNSLGQLDTVTTDGAVVSFTYDGFGRRVTKTTASGTTGYLYDGQNLLAELDGTGNRVAEYTYYPGIDQPHSVRRWSGGTSSMYYYARELPNNVVGLIDNSNTVVDHYSYTPFGTLADSGGSVPNSLRFGAREYDQETGLYYNRARYYDPTLSRFISEDPIGLAGGINPYVYAADDPMNAIDPSGEYCTWIHFDGWGDVEGGVTTSHAGFGFWYCDDTDGSVPPPPPDGPGGAGPGGTSPGYPGVNDGSNRGSPVGPDNGNPPTCSSARAYVGSIGSQLSAAGKNFTWTGIGMVGVSGLGAVLAPEALPAEAGGAELGGNLIELGGAVSTVGSSLQGYAQNGFYGGAKGALVSWAIDKVNSRLTGILFPGIEENTKSATASLLAKIPEALMSEEVACGGA